MNVRIATIIPAIALLAACGGSDAGREEGGAGEAEGEVLGGSISDEMLPLDTVRSQSPTLKPSPSVSTGSEGEVTEVESAEAAESAAPEAPSPAPEEG